MDRPSARHGALHADPAAPDPRGPRLQHLRLHVRRLAGLPDLTRAALALSVLAIAGCTSGGSALYPLGWACVSGSQCAGGLCAEGLCTATCTSATDCTSPLGACGTAADGSRTCAAPCSFSTGGVACRDGTPIACAALTDATCDECGCPSPTDQCTPTGACVPPAALGEPCESDVDCLSQNCDPFWRECVVSVGDACTTSNCERCIHDASGWSYCSRYCYDDYDCHGRGECLGDTTTDVYWCRPLCTDLADPSCRGTCEYPRGAGTLYCANTGWIITDRPRPLLAPCSTLRQCASGTCLVNGANGFCSATCVSSAGCGGGECVHVPCAAGSTSACGDVCVARCTAATEATDCPFDTDCGPLARVEDAATVSVCSPRFFGGHACSSNAQCLAEWCGDTHVCDPYP